MYSTFFSIYTTQQTEEDFSDGKKKNRGEIDVGVRKGLRDG